jgi:hypothetical protein
MLGDVTRSVFHSLNEIKQFLNLIVFEFIEVQSGSLLGLSPATTDVKQFLYGNIETRFGFVCTSLVQPRMAIFAHQVLDALSFFVVELQSPSKEVSEGGRVPLVQQVSY